MTKLFLCALPLALGLAACDGPAEQAGEEIDNINNVNGQAEAQGEIIDRQLEAQGEMIDEASERLDDRAEAVEDTNPAAAQRMENEAEVLEDQADKM
jgi:hypothetical protein